MNRQISLWPSKGWKWIKTFALHQNVGVECKGQV